LEDEIKLYCFIVKKLTILLKKVSLVVKYLKMK